MSINSFDTEIAKLVGVNAAVIYQNIYFWCEKNKANNRNVHEGKVWTYNSNEAFAQLFSYLTARQIRTSLEKLSEHGLIETGNFNKSAYDRTKWYSCSRLNSHLDLTEKSNETDQNVQPIPDSKPNSKQVRDSQLKKRSVTMPTPYEQILDLYLKTLTFDRVYSLVKVKQLTDKRKRVISKLYTEMKRDIGSIQKYFNWLYQDRHQHSWLFGENNRNWKADIEFVCRIDTVVKAREGTLGNWKDGK